MSRSDIDMEGGRISWLCSALLVRLYSLLRSETVRSRLRRIILKLENGSVRSRSIRKILKKHYRITLGQYSDVPGCLKKPNALHPGTSIGRYAFVADTVRTFTRDHPRDTKSTHGVFYNPGLGIAKVPSVAFNSLKIGNGVWIGDYAIILRPAQRIGDGAVIAPGAVVYDDVPPYSIVEGCPARVVGYCVDKEQIAEHVKSCWWEKSLAELRSESFNFCRQTL